MDNLCIAVHKKVDRSLCTEFCTLRPLDLTIECTPYPQRSPHDYAHVCMYAQLRNCGIVAGMKTGKKKRRKNGSGLYVNMRVPIDTAIRIRVHKARKNLPDLPSAIADKFADVSIE